MSIDEPRSTDGCGDAWVGPSVDEHLALLLAEPRSLLDAEPESLNAAGAVDFLVEVQQAQARLAALEARALVAAAGAYRRERRVDVVDEVTGEPVTIVITDVLREEVAAALHRSPGLVHDQMVTARLLAGPLAATGAALAESRITGSHARVIADQARRLSNAHVACHQSPDKDTAADAAEREQFTQACARLQDRVLPLAARSTPGRTRARARAVVAAIDAAAAEKRRQRAKALIDVHVYPDEDGLAVLLARMPIIDAVRAHAALDARARSERAAARGGCTATLGQLRVAALLDALCATTSSGEPAHAPAARVTTEIQIVLPATAVLGESPEPGSVTIGSGGPQPVTAQAVRDLIADPDTPTTIRRLLTDPITGHLLDLGRHSYRVTPALRAWLVTRDGTCRFPGCTRPASRCQIDHAHPWNNGGETTRANLGPLCTRHHQLKTHAHWQITDSHDDGSATWRSPQGRTYHADPPPILPAAPQPPTDPAAGRRRDGPPFPF